MEAWRLPATCRGYGCLQGSCRVASGDRSVASVALRAAGRHKESLDCVIDGTQAVVGVGTLVQCRKQQLCACESHKG